MIAFAANVAAAACNVVLYLGFGNPTHLVLFAISAAVASFLSPVPHEA